MTATVLEIAGMIAVKRTPLDGDIDGIVARVKVLRNAVYVAFPGSRLAAAVLGGVFFTSSDVSTRDPGGTPRHDEMMLHVFAGTPRLGSFADAAESLSVWVDQIDLLHGGSDDDMAVAEARERVLASVRARKYSIVWIGTPCSSFSLWWLDASMRQLRSRERPAGLPSLPRRERAYLRKHNALVEFSAQVALAAFEVGATFVIENPPDRGQLGSPLFRWAARRHAPLWLMPCMRSLTVKTRAVMLTFPQCALGGDFQKWTSLLVAGPRASQLQALGELTCTHGGKHARVAEGRDTQGRSNAAASAAYPIGMAAFVMWALARPAVRHACAFGVPVTVPQRVGGIPARPPSDVAPFVGAALDGVRRYVRAQQQLNAQAAAVFAGETQCCDCALVIVADYGRLRQIV